MALVMGITIPAGLEIIYNKTLKMYDISVMCNVGKNPRFFPRDRKMALREVTYLFTIAYAWSSFTQAIRDNWNLAANVMGEHGYNLYVQDKSYRIKNGIGGNADPSLYHQFKVGHLNISAPASSASIVQYNPHRIYFPASYELCFKTNLTASGDNPSAKLKFIWTAYLGGQNIEHTEIIDLPLISGWDKRKTWITTQAGVKGKWRLELELIDVTGDLWFDNISVDYRGQIQINDPYCENVAYYWKAINMSAGTTLETIYPTGGAL